MATVQVAIVNRALRMLHQLPRGESPHSDESDAALLALNAMLDTWRLERLMCVAMRDESLALVGADPSYTVGASGDLNTVRPVRIDGAYVVVNGMSHPVTVIDQDQYAAITNKTLQAPFPDRVYYQASYPLGVLYPWPVPIDGSATLHILTRTPLVAVALSDTFAFPPGWEDAMASHLAIRLAPEYETTPSDEVVVLARDSMAAIKRANMEPIVAANDLNGLITGGSTYNVYSDTE